jgi:putative transposase
MYLTEKHIIKQSNKLYKEIDELSFKSKNLYNSCLYAIRQHYFDTKKYLNYNSVNRLFIDSNQENYIELPRKVSNHILQQVDKSFKSFFNLLKVKNKLKGNPKIPKYKDKFKGRNILSYELGAISVKELKNDMIKLSGTNILIPFKNINKGKLKEVRIVPCLLSYKIEIIYEVKEKELKQNNNYIGIDFGINNICAVTNNIGKEFFIINGKSIKSINQYYNKRLAELKSNLPKDVFTSRKIRRLTEKRNNKIHCEIHKLTKYIVNYCETHNISKIIIGYNKDWKNESNMGNVNNQKFIQIPFLELINTLKYKARLEGIDMELTEESYTSKCSFFDDEIMKHHDVYKGRRIKRGLFKINDNLNINADINGSLNIIRKVVHEFNFNEVNRGFAVNPMKVFLKTS